MMTPVKLWHRLSLIWLPVAIASCGSDNSHTTSQGGTSTTGGSGGTTGSAGTGGSEIPQAHCFEIPGQTICLQDSDPGVGSEMELPSGIPVPPGGLPPKASFCLGDFTVPDQGQCGSCVAFATRNAMSLRGLVENSQFIDYSAAHIWYIAGYGSADCINGSSIFKVFTDNTSSAAHTVSNATWPYDPAKPQVSLNMIPSSATLSAAGIAYIQESLPILVNDLNDIKAAIAQHWPPVISIPVYGTSPWEGSPWELGHIDVPGPNDNFSGYHAVALTSYDDGSQSFGFVNSWGTDVGDKGFGTMTYGFVKNYATYGRALKQLAFKEPASTYDVVLVTKSIAVGANSEATATAYCPLTHPIPMMGGFSLASSGERILASVPINWSTSSGWTDACADKRAAWAIHVANDDTKDAHGADLYLACRKGAPPPQDAVVQLGTSAVSAGSSGPASARCPLNSPVPWAGGFDLKWSPSAYVLSTQPFRFDLPGVWNSVDSNQRAGWDVLARNEHGEPHSLDSVTVCGTTGLLDPTDDIASIVAQVAVEPSKDGAVTAECPLTHPVPVTGGAGTGSDSTVITGSFPAQWNDVANWDGPSGTRAEWSAMAFNRDNQQAHSLQATIVCRALRPGEQLP